VPINAEKEVQVMNTAENEKKNDLTELVMILDRSGSMSGLESDTIGGYNSMLGKQKETPGTVLVSTVLFNDRADVLYDRVPLDRMPLMTEKEYFAHGCTALLDAVGGAVSHIRRVHREADPANVPAKTIFVITTDGMENSSREYSYDQVKKMVEECRDKDGWEFIFLGANIDAIAEAERFGIRADRAANYNCDHEGTQLNYEVLSEAVSHMRCCHGAPIDGNWKKRIDEDYRKRGR